MSVRNARQAATMSTSAAKHLLVGLRPDGAMPVGRQRVRVIGRA